MTILELLGGRAPSTRVSAEADALIREHTGQSQGNSDWAEYARVLPSLKIQTQEVSHAQGA